MDEFEGISTSMIADVIDHYCVMDHSIRSVNKPGTHLAGSALTTGFIQRTAQTFDSTWVDDTLEKKGGRILESRIG